MEEQVFASHEGGKINWNNFYGEQFGNMFNFFEKYTFLLNNYTSINVFTEGKSQMLNDVVFKSQRFM